MKDYTATELANKTGDVLMMAAREAVEITRHGKPRFVILSYDKFEKLTKHSDPRHAVRNEDLSDTEADELIEALEISVEND